MAIFLRFAARSLFCLAAIIVVLAGCGRTDHAPLEEQVESEATTSTDANIAAEFDQLKRENNHLRSELMAENKAIRGEMRRLESELSGVKRSFDDVSKELRVLNGTVERFGDSLPLEARLQKGFELTVNGTLEDIVPGMEEILKIPIHVQFIDLSEDRIPVIREISFRKTQTAHEHLLDLLRQANPEHVESVSDPKLRIVYVIGHVASSTKQWVIITSRKRAQERGALPACFKLPVK